ncbi:MAG: DNA double-strand break repair nuclease NurA [Armatimonadetes bacterium]|nr:DNA double-strand break repair nuclease NurA [Armatimonadota bacterium]
MRSAPSDMITPYADLPDEVLQKVLGRTAEVAEAVKNLFTAIREQGPAMRDSLLNARLIRRYSDLPGCPESPTVAAVDGGAALEKSMGTDTALAVAVGIEGLSDKPAVYWPGVQYASWQETVPHQGDETATLCRGVMTALELAVLRDAPHDCVLLDGAHLTPIIALSTLLSVNNETLRDHIGAIVTQYDTADALRTVMEKPSIVAVVKYDSSRDLSHSFIPDNLRGVGVGLDDKTLTRFLLEEGEYTAPQKLLLSAQSRTHWISKQIAPLTPTDAARESVRLAINDVVARVNDDKILFTYFKPHAWSPAFRLEIKQEAADDPAQLCAILTGIKEQVVSPEIREPYPQWVADRMAKSVGDALVALRTAVHYDLADSGMGEFAALFAQSYRTEEM